jgi:hypothetical protein
VLRPRTEMLRSRSTAAPAMESSVTVSRGAERRLDHGGVEEQAIACWGSGDLFFVDPHWAATGATARSAPDVDPPLSIIQPG